MLNPTPMDRMVDGRGRPYFLWDCELDLEAFRQRLADSEPEVRAYFLGKMMRQAKPDDVFEFVDLATIRELWPLLERYLGQRRDFWTWLMAEWGMKSHDATGS